jgi:perosamine synthetase
MERIPVAGPWITNKEIEYVADAARNAWYGNSGRYHERFENSFAAYVGRKYALALPSCTSAIHLALTSLGIGPGDEVIVPDITWIGTSAPISYVGATPVFADIDAETWCLSPESFKECISPRTKAVIPVGLYGNMPAWDQILSIARNCGIIVIEDAAQAIGSEYGGKKAGSFGEISVFSFHGTKTMTTGEGGMLVTDDAGIYKRCRFLADHGRVPGEKMFWNTEVAFKYKMSALQAALGLAQLERIDDLIRRKREIFFRYKSKLQDSPDIVLNSEKSIVKNTYWMPTIIVSDRLGIDKEYIIKNMRDRGVDCRPFFYPLSSQPAYQDLYEARAARGRNKITYDLSPFGVNLPSSFRIEEEQVEYICLQLRNILLDTRGNE